jgi:hypothetical protein
MSIGRSWRRAKRLVCEAIDVSCGVLVYGSPVGAAYLVWDWFVR